MEDIIFLLIMGLFILAPEICTAILGIIFLAIFAVPLAAVVCIALYELSIAIAYTLSAAASSFITGVCSVGSSIAAGFSAIGSSISAGFSAVGSGISSAGTSIGSALTSPALLHGLLIAGVSLLAICTIAASAYAVWSLISYYQNQYDAPQAPFAPPQQDHSPEYLPSQHFRQVIPAPNAPAPNRDYQGYHSGPAFFNAYRAGYEYYLPPPVNHNEAPFASAPPLSEQEIYGY